MERSECSERRSGFGNKKTKPMAAHPRAAVFGTHCYVRDEGGFPLPNSLQTFGTPSSSSLIMFVAEMRTGPYKMSRGPRHRKACMLPWSRCAKYYTNRVHIEFFDKTGMRYHTWYTTSPFSIYSNFDS